MIRLEAPCILALCVFEFDDKDGGVVEVGGLVGRFGDEAGGLADEGLEGGVVCVLLGEMGGRGEKFEDDEEEGG